jgi:hypothetical protein
MDKASAELTRIRPARVANSDAKALTRYLGALGLEIGPDRLNDLLVLLVVVMIEVGGGQSLAVGMQCVVWRLHSVAHRLVFMRNCGDWWRPP